MNPDITEAHRLRGWYDSEGTSASYKEYKRDGDTSSIGAGLHLIVSFLLSLPGEPGLAGVFKFPMGPERYRKVLSFKFFILDIGAEKS